MGTCASCKHKGIPGYNYPCCKCDILLHNKYEDAEIRTNGDRIRAMSDEELCEFLSQYKFCDMCVEGCDNCTYNGDCDKRLLQWIKQPVEDK